MPVESSTDTLKEPAISGELERTPFATPDTLRVRCPHCRKLYMVQFADIQEAKPRFECVQCRTRFWLSLSEMDLSHEVIGLPIHVKEAQLKKSTPKREPCPKCFKPVEAGRNECPSCGVVIDKYKNSSDFLDGIPPHSATLGALWKRVIAEYEDETRHVELIRACQRERNLAYAGAQYGQMQKLMPMDETTSRRLREVQALGWVLLDPKRSLRMPRPYARLWQVPLMGATVVIIVGMVSPLFRNMVGIGAALLFLAAAFRIHFRDRG